MGNKTSKKTMNEIAMLCSEMMREGSDLNKEFKAWEKVVHAVDMLELIRQE